MSMKYKIAGQPDGGALYVYDVEYDTVSSAVVALNTMFVNNPPHADDEYFIMVTGWEDEIVDGVYDASD
ncbi:MAG: hypothetical protein WC489_07725 [Patescibacteria group bacterium]